MKIQAPKLWTAEEAAAYLRVDPETLRRWSRTGQITAYKLGAKAWRYRQADLDAFVKSREV